MKTKTTSTKKALRPLHIIANEIRKDWGTKIYFGAKPYLTAMSGLHKITDNYGVDSAKSIVNYFLCNASTWRGEKAREIKKELRAMVK